MEKKQTAVEWLVEQMDIKNPAWLKEKIQKAKQMEKEQMKEASRGYDFDKWYNETYGGQE